MCFCCIFFFSSRRRHTRFKCDWSSDVCSSDLRVLALIGLVVLWEALARAGAVPVLFLPSPVGVLREGWDMLLSGELLVHLGASLQRLAWGFVIGSVLGIAIGVAVGFFAVAEAIGTPLIAATFP